MKIHEAIARYAHGNRDVAWEQLSEAARQDWMERVRPIAEAEKKRMKPIIFSGAMVRALLEGRKTMTRRLIKPRGRCSLFDGSWTDSYVLDEGNAEWRAREIPYAVGDRLYVRESYRPNDLFPDDWDKIIYRADVPADAIGPWKPAIHIPKSRTRITLTVEAVKVERLQDISEEDAKAEGCNSFGPVPGDPYPEESMTFGSAVEAFENLWQSINAKRAPWDSNPWVVAITFKVHKCNIDRIPISNEAERRVKELLEPEAA